MTIIHHVSIINREAKRSFDFYRHILGLDLMMKTVNQDDNNMYHLFFGDRQGRAGTEVTIFEIQDGKDKSFGTNAIERLMLKVPDEASLHFWMDRFDQFDVCHYGIEYTNQRAVLRFEGPDQTFLGLTVMHPNEDLQSFHTPVHNDIPEAHRILAIDSVHLRTRYPAATIKELEQYYTFTTITQGHFFDTELPVYILSNNDDAFQHEIHVIHDTASPDAVDGIGSIHHIALSIDNETALNELHHALESRHFTLSPVKDREFFKSLYYREPNKLLFEVAAKGTHQIEQPNQAAAQFVDIPLLLPEFLEHKRTQIEAELLKRRS